MYGFSTKTIIIDLNRKGEIFTDLQSDELRQIRP